MKQQTKSVVLVTGGAGFIGTNLCEKLLSEGREVFCLDNLFCSSKKNIEKFMTLENFTFIKHNINRPLPQIAGIKEIYNLACPASPVWYQKDPVATLKTNTLGIINVLEFARKNKCRVLQASTSEIYGDPEEHPQKESYRGNVNTLGPRACYDEGKRASETLMMDYHRKYGVDIRIIRIFNTYGPYMAENDGRVVSNFIFQALRNKPVTIYGNGKQTRCFQYIDDLVEAMIKMMAVKNFIGPINIGNPVEQTVKTLAEKIIELCGSKSKIVYKPLPIDDPQKRRPDITLANTKLNWAPKIALEIGLTKTIEYFRSNLK